MKNKFKKLLSVVLSFSLIMGFLPIGLVSPSVEATDVEEEFTFAEFMENNLDNKNFFTEIFDKNSDKVKKLQESSESIILDQPNGNYLLKATGDEILNLTPQNNKTDTPPIKVSSGVTVNLYIYGNVNISVPDLDKANQIQPIAPGIHLPSSSTLYLRGNIKSGQTVNIKGGRASNGADGVDGDDGWTAKDNNKKTGNAGSGGAGGAGAGAGIGSYGGTGGSGGEGEKGEVSTAHQNTVGGSRGSDGKQATDSCGSVYILFTGAGKLSIQGGDSGKGGKGGNSGASTYNDSGKNTLAAGGAGGGGGGGGGKAQAIGSGGSGGGGGGGGGCGTCDEGNSNTSIVGGNGGGGGASADGNYGGGGAASPSKKNSGDMSHYDGGPPNEAGKSHGSGGNGGNARPTDYNDNPHPGSLGGSSSIYKDNISGPGGNGGTAHDINTVSSTKVYYTSSTPSTSAVSSRYTGITYREVEDLNSATIKVKKAGSYVYNSKPIEPEVELLNPNDSNKPIESDNYNVVYSNNTSAYIRDESFKNQKQYFYFDTDKNRPPVPTITINKRPSSTYLSSFSRNANFDIQQESITKVTIGDIPDIQYQYEPATISPADLNVTFEGGPVADSEYDIKLSNYEKVGPANVILTAKPEGNFKGTVNKPFNIIPIDINKSKISANLKNGKSYYYTGNKITIPPEDIEVRDENHPTQSSQTLLNGTDYVISQEQEILNAGNDYSVKVIGIGNYIGEREINITVSPLNFDQCDVKAEPIQDKEFNGQNQVPSPYLTYRYPKGLGNYKKLNLGQDYTITSYSNNQLVSTDAKKATIYISGIGNFVGNLTHTFKIVAKTLHVYPESQTFEYGITKSQLDNLKLTYVVDGKVSGFEPEPIGKLSIDISKAQIPNEDGELKVTDLSNYPEGDSLPAGYYPITQGNLDLSKSEANKNYQMNFDSRNVNVTIANQTKAPADIQISAPTGANGWYTSPVILTAPAGGYTISNSSSPGEVSNGGKTITIKENGIYKDYTCNIRNGNSVYNPQTFNFKIDTAKPKIDRTNAALTGDNYETSEKIELKISNLGSSITSGADNGASLKLEVSKNGGLSWTTILEGIESINKNTTEITASYNADSNGEYIFKVTNGAGVSVTETINVTNVDTTKPRVGVELLDADGNPYTGANSDSWTNKDINITISNLATNLGAIKFHVEKIYTDLEGNRHDSVTIYEGESKSGNNTLKIEHTIEGNTTESAGTFEYLIQLTSAAGIESEVKTVTIKGHKVLPSINIKVKDTENAIWTSVLEKITFTNFFKVSKTVNIETSHPVPTERVTTQYCLFSGTENGDIDLSSLPKTNTPEDIETAVNGKWINSTTLNINPNKKYVIYAKATDSAGNVNYASSDGLVVDGKAPTLEINYPYDGTWTYDEDSAIKIRNVNDNLSGIKRLYYKCSERNDDIDDKDENDFATNSETVPIEFANGQSFVKIFAEDNAGNTTQSNIVRVYKDQVVPQLDVTFSKDSDTHKFKFSIIAYAGPSGIKTSEVKELNWLDYERLTTNKVDRISEDNSKYGEGYRYEYQYEYSIDENEYGEYTFRITNWATNSATITKEIKKVDALRPSIEVSATADGTSYNSGTWTNKNVLIRFRNTNSDAKNLKYEYRQLGEPDHTETPPGGINDSEPDYTEIPSNEIRDGYAELEVSETGVYNYEFKITSTAELYSNKTVESENTDTAEPEGTVTTELESKATFCVKMDNEDKLGSISIKNIPANAKEVSNGNVSENNLKNNAESNKNDIEWSGSPEGIRKEIFFKETPPKAQITVTPPLSGIKSIKYCIKSGDENQQVESFKISTGNVESEVAENNWKSINIETEGDSSSSKSVELNESLTPNKQYVVYAKIESNSGCTSYISTDIITVDNTEPNFTVDYPNNGVWTNEASISIKDITDNLSGIKSVSYKINDGEPITASEEIEDNALTLNSFDDGEFNLQITVTDNAGNSKTYSDIMSVKQDSVQPIVELKCDDSTPAPVQKILITVSNENEVKSGIKSISILEPGAEEPKTIAFPPEKPYEAKSDGDYVIYVTSNSGVESEKKTIKVENVKAKTPVLNVQPIITNTGETYNDGQWVNSDISITLIGSSENLPDTGNSENLPQIKYLYKINDGEYKELKDTDGKYIINDKLEDGIYIYTFKIVDAYGIESEEKTLTFKKDTTPPSVKISSGNNEWLSINNNIHFNSLYFQEPQIVKITGSDDAENITVRARSEENATNEDNSRLSQTSDISKIEYFILKGQELEDNKNNLPKSDVEIEQLVGDRWTEGTDAELPAGDKYIVYARITDNAGNKRYANTDGIVIDNQDPKINVYYLYDGIWTSKASVVIESISDDVSGIKSASYVIDNGEPTEIDLSEGSITIDNFTDGIHTLYATAEDYSGNKTETEKVEIKQDSVKPKIILQYNDNGEYETEKVISIYPTTGASGLKSIQVQYGDELEWHDIELIEENGVYRYAARGDGLYKFRIESNAGLFSDEASQSFEKIDAPLYTDSNTSTFLKEGDYKATLYIGILGIIAFTTLAMIYVSKRGRKDKKGKRK